MKLKLQYFGHLMWRTDTFENNMSEWVKWVKSLSHVRLSGTPWTVAYQILPSMGFSRQEYWNGLPFPSPGDLPDPGIEPRSPKTLYHLSPQEKTMMLGKLKAGGEEDNRGWDGWMASPNQWTWVWVNSGSWWWTGRPSVLHSMGSQRVRHDWATELNWTGWTQRLPYWVK